MAPTMTELIAISADHLIAANSAITEARDYFGSTNLYGSDAAERRVMATLRTVLERATLLHRSLIALSELDTSELGDLAGEIAAATGMQLAADHPLLLTHLHDMQVYVRDWDEQAAYMKASMRG